MRTLFFVVSAIVGIVGGSVWAVGDSPLPHSQPVSWIETKCPDQKLKPQLDYASSCVQQAVAEYKF